MSFAKRSHAWMMEQGARCDICPLRGHSRPVAGELRRDALAIIIGQAPTAEDVEEGRPLCDIDGQELMRALKHSGISRTQVSLTNATACRFPNDDVAGFLAKISKENKKNKKLPGDEGHIPSPFACCKPRLDAEIGDQENRVTLGGYAAQSAIPGKDDAKVLNLRGHQVPLPEGGKVFPTVHPSFVRHQRRWTHVFYRDLRSAFAWFGGKDPWVPPRCVNARYQKNGEPLRNALGHMEFFAPSVTMVRDYLRGEGKWWGKRPKWVVYDLETDGIRTDKLNIRCIGVGGVDHVMIIPFLSVNGIDRFYTPQDEEQIVAELRRFAEDESILKVGHNAGSFDRMCFENVWGATPTPLMDTVLVHKGVDAELPHTLNFVGSFYTSVHAWKDEKEGGWNTKFDAILWEYCLFQSVRVLKADGTRPTIKQMVQQRDPGPVLAWNAETGQMEARRVTAWHHTARVGQKWLRLTVAHQTRHDANLIVTPDHRVYVRRDGQVIEAEAQHVVPGDAIVRPVPYHVGTVLGFILGDGHLGRSPLYIHTLTPPKACLTTGHVHESYARAKAAWLGASLEQLRRGAPRSPFWHMTTSMDPWLGSIRPDFYGEGKERYIPEWALEAISLAGWAIWFMDDGCAQGNGTTDKEDGMRLSLNRYSEEDGRRVQKALGSLIGIPVGYSRANKVVTIANQAAKVLCRLLGPYVVDEMRYKFPHPMGPFIGWPSQAYDVWYDEITAVEDYQVGAAPSKQSGGRQRYCLTVEGLHNFFTVLGLVRNCMNDVCVNARCAKPLVQEARNREQLRGPIPPVAQLSQDISRDAVVRDHAMQSLGVGLHRVGEPVRQHKRAELEKECIAQVGQWRDRSRSLLSACNVPETVLADAGIDQVSETMDEEEVEEWEAFNEAAEMGGLDVDSFNPGSHVQVRRLIEKVWDLPEPMGLGKKDMRTGLKGDGDLRTGKAVLQAYMVDKRLSKQQRALFHSIFMYRRWAKRFGSEVRPARYAPGETKPKCFIWEDGRIHSNWNAHGTLVGRFSCVSGDTRLATSRGLFRFDEYVPEWGDTVLTHTGAQRRVKQKIYKGSGQMYRVRLDTGAELKCTADHRVWTPSGWQRIGDLRVGSEVWADGSFCAMGLQPGERGEGRGDVPGGRQAYNGGDSETGRDCASKRAFHLEGGHDGARVEGRTGTSLLQVQTSATSPEAGTVWLAEPELEGRGVHHEGWLRDASSRHQSGLRARPSHRDGGSSRNGAGCSSFDVGGSSHRRGQEAQRPGQSGAGDEFGSQPDSRSHEWLRARIAEVHALGVMGVWDIEVEGDHSYVTQGFISHNSSGPNAQNRSPWFKPCIGFDYEHANSIDAQLKLMKAKDNPELYASLQRQRLDMLDDDDMVLVGADVEGIHLRIIAVLWDIPSLQESFAKGYDAHSVFAELVMGDTYRNAEGYPGYGLKPGKGTLAAKFRDMAKTLRYAGAYGAEPPTIYRVMRSLTDDYGRIQMPNLAIDEVRMMHDNWMTREPEWERAWNRNIDTWKRTGFVKTPMLGRRRYFLDQNENDIRNYEILATEGDIMGEITQEFVDEIPFEYAGPGTGLINQCHDALYAQVRKKDGPRAQELMRSLMDKPRGPIAMRSGQVDIGLHMGEVAV